MTIPTYQQPTGVQLAQIGLLTNVGLCAAKLIGGIVGHSGALVADAVESLADIAGSVVIWSGLRWSSMPADEDHPYGHGKAEALSAMVVVGVMLAAAGGIAVKAYHDIRTPHESPAPFTLVLLLVVIALKGGLFLIARRVAQKEHSVAIEADAGHHVADAITSLAALIGISAALFGQRTWPNAGFDWATADDWAALLASVVIAYNALAIARSPFNELMDRAGADLGPEVIQPAVNIAKNIEGVKGIEKVHARKSGAGYWLEMHVQVRHDMPVSQAHIVGGIVRSRIRKELPKVRDVLVHIEPFDG